ncbi:hypothetical protein [uncultured Paludibaculum sp.]|uniref:hypothetical protein n=1 Tax=uncultured Paludibaculum sp. TaxID=1765020 RepID=UPI002AAB7F08|nr:hypothetical protein [uncultured Paludibaculum sp.]
MNTDTRRQVHALIDQLPPTQLAAVQGLLEAMMDPVARSLASAPVDDEPLTQDESDALDRSEEWLKHHEPIPHEEILAEFGLTTADFPLKKNGA